MPTLILAIVCVILILVLYVVSGGWKKYGGLLGIFKWIRSGAQMGPTGSRMQTPTNHAHSSSAADAVQVLREIYTEFETRCEVLSARIDKLEQFQWELEALVRSSSAHASDSDSVASAVTVSAVAAEGKYFQILDLLEAGRTEAEIINMLSVEFQDIAYVRRMMASPQLNSSRTHNRHV